jgi:hypothetical protein
VPRERGIERDGTEALRALGWWQCKVGYDGWPDRLVIWAPGRHFWWEVKQPDGSLTTAQKVRIARMRASSEPVFLFDSRAKFYEFLEVLR